MDQICVTTSLATVFSPSFLDELSIHKRFFLVECSPQKKLKCQVTWDSPTKPLLFGGTVAGLRYGMPKLAFHILNLRKPSNKKREKNHVWISYVAILTSFFFPNSPKTWSKIKYKAAAMKPQTSHKTRNLRSDVDINHQTGWPFQVEKKVGPTANRWVKSGEHVRRGCFFFSLVMGVPRWWMM